MKKAELKKLADKFGFSVSDAEAFLRTMREGDIPVATDRPAHLFDNKAPEAIIKALSDYRESQNTKWRTNIVKMRKWSTDEFIAFATTNAVNLQLLSPMLESEQTKLNADAQLKAEIDAHNKQCSEQYNKMQTEFINKMQRKNVLYEGDIFPSTYYKNNTINDYKKLSADIQWPTRDLRAQIAIKSLQKRNITTLKLIGLHVDSDTSTVYAVLRRLDKITRIQAESVLSDATLNMLKDTVNLSNLQHITYATENKFANCKLHWARTPIESYTTAEELIEFINCIRSYKLVFGYYLQDIMNTWHFVQAGDVLEATDPRRKGPALFNYIKSIRVTSYPTEFLFTRSAPERPPTPPKRPFAPRNTTSATIKKWCAILEIAPDERFNKEVVKANYKRLALLWHPDRNMDDIANATTKMQALNEAYDGIMSD